MIGYPGFQAKHFDACAIASAVRAIRISRAIPRPRAASSTHMRLISAQPSWRTTAPVAKAFPSTSRATKKRTPRAFGGHPVEGGDYFLEDRGWPRMLPHDAEAQGHP